MGARVTENGSRGMRLITGNSNQPLADAIGQHLKLPYVKAAVRRFSDMEIFVEVQENVRGEDMFVIQSTSYPTNDNLMELLIMIDALRRASARRITAVIPYFRIRPSGPGKVGPRTPISRQVESLAPDHRSWRPTAFLPSICMPVRSRASSIFPPTIFSPCPSFTRTLSSILAGKIPWWCRPTSAAFCALAA